MGLRIKVSANVGNPAGNSYCPVLQSRVSTVVCYMKVLDKTVRHMLAHTKHFHQTPCQKNSSTALLKTFKK